MSATLPLPLPAAATPPPAPVTALPALREELLLHRGPPAHDGAPTWTLEDPGRGLFFQIGWAEAEILARWRLGEPVRIAAAVNRDTALEIDADEVQALAQFLDQQSLLQLRGEAACERYVREHRAAAHGHWLRWLIHHYLFFRVPLLSPDRLLERSLPWVRRWWLRRRFALATAFAAVLGLLLAARQWDSFVHTFLHFFTLEGALIAALTLSASKILHEFGHAWVAKHFGCRVGSMGVAFIVAWPVLYTDASGAWRLRSRRQRIAIGAAGMLTEATLAAWATLAWSFLPDGMLRSAAFMLATTTWLLTLAVNLNPFARFDGYFLLADALNVPNLQPRAFALARWQLREWLFGFADPIPETFAPWRQRALLIYAFSTWIYRLFLFLGIALLVYHFAFKLLGIVLFAIEIVCFVLRPVLTELRLWSTRLRAEQTRWNRRSLRSVALTLAALALVAIPWQGRVKAPALARAAAQVRLIAPVGGRLERLPVADGQPIRAGTALFVFSSPDLDHEVRTLRRRIALLDWQQAFQPMHQTTAARVPVARREQQAARERLAELERQQAQATVRAGFDGVLIDRAEPLAAGDWIGAGEWLGTLAAPGRAVVEAYVGEADLRRIRAGEHARFLPEDPRQPAWSLRVRSVAATATRRLGAVPELASVNGGAIAAERAPPSAHPEQTMAGDEWMPEQAVYRILLEPAATAPAGLPRAQALRGTVLIDAEAESLLRRTWRRLSAVLVRESGF